MSSRKVALALVGIVFGAAAGCTGYVRIGERSFRFGRRSLMEAMCARGWEHCGEEVRTRLSDTWTDATQGLRNTWTESCRVGTDPETAALASAVGGLMGGVIGLLSACIVTAGARFRVSAIFESVISFSKAGSSGMGQASSPTSLPAS